MWVLAIVLTNTYCLIESPLRQEFLNLLPEPYVHQPLEPAPDKDAMDVDEKPSYKDSLIEKGSKTIEAEKEKAKEAEQAKKEAAKKEAAKKQLFEQPHVPIPEAASELETYLSLLVSIYLLDYHKFELALKLLRSTHANIVAKNQRSLDLLGAKVIYYIGRSAELIKQHLKKGSALAGERDFLLDAHRTASLRQDAETQATIINLLLRYYLVESNLYEQADKLVARAPFPRLQVSNGQIARFEYYVGRIRAVQLNYTEAHEHLQHAIRRAPQPAVTPAGAAPGSGPSYQSAAGFLQSAYKLFVVVELLMGDIPERSIFRIDALKKPLAPYLEIVQAVRVGDLAVFQRTLSRYESLFKADKTLSLIIRLRHNVIKTGIRMISLAYSQISLKDVTRKLSLESEEDAEYIIAKAIRDGVIEAKVHHEEGYMESREKLDIYATSEPLVQFNQRIAFTLQLHNESLKAMRYPLNHHKAELAKAASARERERELANEIADAEMDESDDDWL